MPSIKNKWIKPGVDFNYATGVLVQASEDIARNQMVVVTGVTGGDATNGGMLVVSIADVTDDTRLAGQGFISKNAIPSGSRGVVLPWRIVPFDTSTALAVGQEVYCGTTGNFVLQPVAGALVLGKAGNVAVIGGAGVGRILFAPNAPSSRNQIAAYAGNMGGGVQIWEFTVANTGLSGVPRLALLPLRIIDVWAVATDAAPAGAVDLVVTAGTVCRVSLAGAATGDSVRASAILNTDMAFTNTITTASGVGGNMACKLYVMTISNT